MNEKTLFQALSDIDDDLIEGASRPPKRNPLLIYLPTAAAACLCIVICLFAFWKTPQNGSDGVAARSGNGATEASLSIPIAPPGNESLYGAGTDPFAAPTGASVQHFCQSDIPGDFSFRLSWNGKQYSSEDRQYTQADGVSRPLSLTAEELKNAWLLIEEATEDGSSSDSGFILDYTANGEVYHLEFSTDCVPMQELGELLDEASDRLR